MGKKKYKKKTMIRGISVREHSFLHYKLRKNFGSATMCEGDSCTNPQAKRFYWALKKGHQYSDQPVDYLQLCASCHVKYDLLDETRLKLRNNSIGEKAPASKLTESQVLEIFERIDKGDKITHIANFFGVKQSTVSCIHTGRSWTYLGKRNPPIKLTPPQTK